jgi:MFS-type transporter involved in bile tolerance (Atg22 family)
MSGNLLIAGIFLFLGAFLNGWSVTGPRTMLQELPQVAGVRSGTALGMLNTFSRAAAALFPLIFAALSSIVGKPQNALTIICCLAIVSSICMALVKRDRNSK